MTDSTLEDKLRKAESALNKFARNNSENIASVDKLAREALDYAAQTGQSITIERKGKLGYPLANFYIDKAKEMIRDMQNHDKNTRNAKSAYDVFGLLDNLNYYKKRCNFTIREEETRYIYKQAFKYAVDVMEDLLRSGKESERRKSTELLRKVKGYIRLSGIKTKQHEIAQIERELHDKNDTK